MRRRDLLAGLAAATALRPLRLRAQTPRRRALIGQLSPRAAPSGEDEAFRQALRALGYEGGRDIDFAFRGIAGDAARLAELARELVRLEPAVIFAAGSEAARAAIAATKEIPIVITSSDPMRVGAVTSLGRPAGNVTGVSSMNAEVSGKRLELLKELIPTLASVATVWNPEDPGAHVALEATEMAARALGVRLQIHEAHSAAALEAALAAVRGEKVDALLMLPAPLISDNPALIAASALQSRLPAMTQNSNFPRAGGLLSYGSNGRDGYRRAAAHVDKLLKGATPADLPIDQATTFELVINLKTAKALGLAIPPALLARADDVIE
jgi:putative ABC transport system substrate-binding protein